MTDTHHDTFAGFTPEMAALIGAMHGLVDAQRATVLSEDGYVTLTSVHNPVNFAVKSQRQVHQAALIENPLTVPVLVGLGVPAIAGQPFVRSVPPLSGRIIARPHTDLSIGVLPALTGALPAAGGMVYVGRFDRFVNPASWSLANDPGAIAPQTSPGLGTNPASPWVPANAPATTLLLFAPNANGGTVTVETAAGHGKVLELEQGAALPIDVANANQLGFYSSSAGDLVIVTVLG